MPNSLLVVGCSEQLPDAVRAYRLMGMSSEGALVLSRHGATYSAASGQVSEYRAVLERLLGRVLPALPSSRRVRARQALITRWNRDWGVEAEDLDQHGGQAANDNGSAFATESFETSTSPFEHSRANIDSDGSIEPQAALAGS